MKKPKYRLAYLTDTTSEHIATLAASMRAEDKQEVLLTSRSTPMQALQCSVAGSSETFTGWSPEGKILCITGVAPYSLISSVGSPWMLTSEEMLKNPKSLLWYTRVLLERWKQEYKLLENFVDARYKPALRWAEWAGFTVDPPKRYGFRGAELCRITMEGY